MTPRPRVLVIGDSTTRHMADQLHDELDARGIAPTIDARSGRTVRQGLGVLRSRWDVDEYNLVVALLGANGHRPNMRRDFARLKAAGVHTAATVQAPQQRSVNNAIREVFGTDRIRWAGFAKRLGIRPYDGKHYKDYGPRAQYIASRIAAKVGTR
jgi:hypothetical protein